MTIVIGFWDFVVLSIVVVIAAAANYWTIKMLLDNHRDKALKAIAAQYNARHGVVVVESLKALLDNTPARYSVRLRERTDPEVDPALRWQWKIMDADASIRQVIDLETHDHEATEDRLGIDIPFMVQGAPTPERAYMDALAWVWEHRGEDGLVPDAVVSEVPTHDVGVEGDR